MADEKSKTPRPAPATRRGAEAESAPGAEARPSPRPFDVKTVEHLIKLMKEHDLTEIDLREGEHRVRLCKGGPATVAAAPVHAVHAPPPLAPAAHVGTSPPAPPPAATGPKLLEIKSELVGSFYARSSPDKPEFVKVGSRVTPETTVCLVIAMKVNNEIKAGVSGTVREVCVKNEEFVDYGTVLFRVDPG